MGAVALRALTRDEEKAYMHDKNDKLKRTVAKLVDTNAELQRTIQEQAAELARFAASRKGWAR